MHHQQKEPQTSVCWRVKNSSLEWLRQQATQQDRPVTYVVNQVLAQARAQKTQGAQQ